MPEDSSQIQLQTKADQPVDVVSNTYGDELSPGTLQALRWRRKHLFLLFISVATAYVLISVAQYASRAPGINYYPHFIYLADGWLHGHLFINTLPASTNDYTFYHGHWYVAFPPLPAVLLLPFVALFHLSHQDFVSLSFSVGMGIINIGLMLWVLRQFARMREVQLTFSTMAWVLVFFALGSEVLYVTMQPSVWFQAHIVATTFLLLHIGETLGKRRSWLAGIFLGLAALSRSTTLFTFPFFLLLTFALERKRPKILLKQFIIFGTTLGLFVLGMLLYNWIRFGSLFDFGYASMNIDPLVRSDLHNYGQFSLHFLGTNLHYMWIQLPFLVKKFPYVTFTPFGTGIFWTTPALLLAFLAFRQRCSRWLALALLAGCLLPLTLLLLYFNTGWVQFGNRFSMDYLPLVILLATLGMRPKPGWPEKLLIILSISINVWGYIVFAYFPFAIHTSFLK